jgi:hypothetical protein
VDLTDQNAKSRKTGMKRQRRNGIQNFTVYPNGWKRKQYLGQNHNRVPRRRLTYSRVRRDRSVPGLKRELGQVHLRQNENDGE